MGYVVIVGGQFGSESKGRVAADLHRARHISAGVRVGGPNAGHTVVGKDGTAYALRQLPVAAVADKDALLVIAAGSEIELAVLGEEIRLLENDGYSVTDRLIIDPQATILDGSHKLREADLTFGTTGKGIGAARSDRLLRKAALAEDFPVYRLPDGNNVGELLCDTAPLLNVLVSSGYDVLIEGTQGYGLGLHAGYYPHCTSGDCRAIDFLAQVGATPKQAGEAEVWVVVRTHPIRIAGNSGPLVDETTWETVGVPPEFTTVTKKMRRVGEWDAGLVAKAVRANGGLDAKVALAFADYWWPELKGVGGEGLRAHESVVLGVAAKLLKLETEIGAPIRQLGTGPDSCIWL